MYQQCEHIIFDLKIAHVILETQCIDRNALSSKHPHNVRPESVKIHVHIYFERLICFCRSPVIRQHMTFHRRHYRPRIINVLILSKTIPIVPVTDLTKIHIILTAQRFHFLLGKTSVLLIDKRVCHGILPKHIQCRMLSIFFNRQNSCHIGERDIGLIL